MHFVHQHSEFHSEKAAPAHEVSQSELYDAKKKATRTFLMQVVLDVAVCSYLLAMCLSKSHWLPHSRLSFEFPDVPLAPKLVTFLTLLKITFTAVQCHALTYFFQVSHQLLLPWQTAYVNMVAVRGDEHYLLSSDGDGLDERRSITEGMAESLVGYEPEDHTLRGISEKVQTYMKSCRGLGTTNLEFQYNNCAVLKVSVEDHPFVQVSPSFTPGNIYRSVKLFMRERRKMRAGHEACVPVPQSVLSNIRAKFGSRLLIDAEPQASGETAFMLEVLARVRHHTQFDRASITSGASEHWEQHSPKESSGKRQSVSFSSETQEFRPRRAAQERSPATFTSNLQRSPVLDYEAENPSVDIDDIDAWYPGKHLAASVHGSTANAQHRAFQPEESRGTVSPNAHGAAANGGAWYPGKYLKENLSARPIVVEHAQRVDDNWYPGKYLQQGFAGNSPLKEALLAKGLPASSQGRLLKVHVAESDRRDL